MEEDLQESDMQEIVEFVEAQAGANKEELTGLLFQVYYMEEELRNCQTEILKMGKELNSL